MNANDAKKLKELEKENSRLKTIVADVTLDVSMLKDPIAFIRASTILGKPQHMLGQSLPSPRIEGILEISSNARSLNSAIPGSRSAQLSC